MENMQLLTVLTGLCYLSFCASQNQYVLFQTPKTWKEAQSYCREKCVDLTTFYNMKHMKTILKRVEGKYDDDVWFGLVKGKTMGWHWSITASGFYKEGENNYLRWGTSPFNLCGTYKEGYLYTQPCHYHFPSVCFDVKTDGTAQYILNTTPMGWTEALHYCRDRYFDLTSMRNEEEHSAVRKLVDGQEVWVGVFCDPWAWSDGIYSALRYFTVKQEVGGVDAEDCGVLLRNESGKWGTRECSETHPFICSCRSSEISKRRYKVRISTKDSTLDLNDPAVQESILEQMKLKMTGTGQEKLQWNKQPDGRVFIKDDL
ncbi:C-type mannose receptor 2-like isoform X2 [Cololabis saira]|uniref:C-type mannose receptor 2-like isoform X2 n=1 Tax=Cololabis saira TaxID=129043 RepID=UPI002AD34778|nr:C-type mannose receptor 2-like isoform X2 [Cololabis saira]